MAKPRPPIKQPPVMAFITPPQTGNNEAADQEGAAPYPLGGETSTNTKERIVYMKPETKSKHLHALIKPSIYEKARQHAKDQGISLNEYLNRILEQYA